MKIVLIDLPKEENANIRENCKAQVLSGDILIVSVAEWELRKMDVSTDLLIISGNSQVLSWAICQNIAVIAYQEPNGMWISLDVDMVIEGFEEVDFMFFERVYRRHHGLPWTILETDRLLVRELALSDMDALFELYSYEGMTNFMEKLYPYEEEYAYQKAYIENMYGFFGYGMWLVFEKETGKLVGRAGIEHREELQGELELGYAIGTPYQNRGYAAEVCREILVYVKENLGFPSVCSLIKPQNAASMRLAEKLGFCFEEEIRLSGEYYKKYRYSFKFAQI